MHAKSETALTTALPHHLDSHTLEEAGATALRHLIVHREPVLAPARSEPGSATQGPGRPGTNQSNK